MKDSKIEWCTHTFNPWIGCTRVSPGCAHCYAAEQDKFRKWTPEGWGGPRKRTSPKNWLLPIVWNSKAADAGTRMRVFCASLADWLDDEVPIEWLKDLLCLIALTPHLDWLLLTKRPENFRRRIQEVADGWQSSCEIAVWWSRGVEPFNVWIGTTVENQAMAEKRIPELLEIPAMVRFLSCEPLLGPVDLTHVAMPDPCECCEEETWFDAFSGREMCGGSCDGGEKIHRIDWVICGGESGPKARPMHGNWARSLRDQCNRARIPFLFKQWGEWAPWDLQLPHPKREAAVWPDGRVMAPQEFVDYCLPLGGRDPKWGVHYLSWMGKSRAGRILDSCTHDEFPKP